MRPLKTLFAACIFLIVSLNAHALELTSLRCEDRENPCGIDAPQPRLSWQMVSSRRNEAQSAYQILVASSEKKLAPGHADLWDSGKVASDRSIQIPYAGPPLASRTPCFWKVRVWDQAGKVSAWSAPASWTMGLLRPEDWGGAKWIGLDGVEKTVQLTNTFWIWAAGGEPEKSAAAGNCYFRRVVTIPPGRTVASAQFQYAGDEECRGYIDQFDLGARKNFHSVKFNDVTTRLEPGHTYVFGLLGYHPKAGTPAGVAGLLEIHFTEGEPLLLPTDENWKVSDHEIPGWLQTNFDDSAWAGAKKIGAIGMPPWGDVRSAETRTLPARYLRKDFSIAKNISRATVSFSGLGLSELYLNGRKIGDHVLSPAFAQYDKREFYVTYDLTRELRRGSNAMGVILGNGRFYADRSKVYTGTVNFGFPKLCLNLKVEYADGSASEIVSDGSWKVTADGPIIRNNDFDGEEYDARKELPGWCSPGGDDSTWQAAQEVAAPGGELSAEMQEPIRVTGKLKPVSLKEIRPGVFIYDLGQNLAGWCRLRVAGPAGARVTLRHAETLKPDGTLYLTNLRGARATDVYTLKGAGEEVWEPRFTSHGFRFVELSGYPGKPSLDSIEARVVNDDLKTTGAFECSNALINRIYRAIVWGVRGNYRSIPTDCPQRDERQGWLGDRSEESRGETYLFDNSNLYAKWLDDMADAQRTNGSVPDIAPAYWPIYSDNVSWPSSGVIIPGMLRGQFGDAWIIGRHYPSAKKWMDHMNEFVKNGIISRDTYGDWCVPPDDPHIIHTTDPARLTDKTLLATSYFYHDCKLMEQYATRLGKTEDARAFRDQAEVVKAAFNEKFLDRRRGQYDNGTQTSCVLPLAFGMVPEDQRASVFHHLVDKLENETHRHIGTGLVGGQYLCRVLTDNGRPDLVYAMATQKDYPSWGYMIENGATTIWELWNGNTADPTMNSGNHVMLVGDFVTWLYEDLAGIKPEYENPAFKHLLMKPLLVEGLSHVKATHLSPYGLISSEWNHHGNVFDWRIEIPANTTATVSVPVPKRARVGADGVTPVKVADGSAIFELGGGKYHFVSK